MRQKTMTMKRALVVVLLLASAGCVRRQTHINSPTTIDPALLDTARAIVGSPDRSADDRALDAGRHPDRLLAFIGVRPGMRVAEIGAGLGYTTELLARAVAPSGVVYAQNNQFIREKFAEQPWTARLAKPVRKAHTRVEFLRAVLICDESGSLHATPLQKQGSGQLRGVAEADALIMLPETAQEYAVGTVVEVLALPGWA